MLIYNIYTYIFLKLTSSTLDSKLREDLERLKKIKAHRGLRHYWGYVYKFIIYIILTVIFVTILIY